MKTAILLYDGFTPLDAIGPYHAIGGLPGFEFSFVAEHRGPVSNGGNFTMEAQQSIDEIDALDVLLVPGGVAAITMAPAGGPLVEWIRAIHPTTTWTTSVCTGSLLLAAAGVLDGLPATSHWLAVHRLADHGAIPTEARVVVAGKVATAAGVSAGIDLSLVLAAELSGEETAQTIQLFVEYDPRPPFDAGSPATAPAHLVAAARSASRHTAR